MEKLKYIILLGILLTTSVLAYAEQPAQESEALKEVKARLKAIYNTNNINDAYRIVSSIPENERDSEVWFLLANITQDLNEPEDAIFYFQKAILTDEKNDKAYYNLGNLYLDKGQVYNAIKMYKEAIKIKGDFAPYHFNLGCAYLKAKDDKNAKTQFAKAVFLQPNEPNYRYNLALAYKNLGNTKKAQQELDIYNKLTRE